MKSYIYLNIIRDIFKYNMNSSYNNFLNYGDLLKSIIFLKNPKSILEIGILDGYSLKIFGDNSNKDTKIEAYDIFDDFNGNHGNKEQLIDKFKEHNNITIQYGDFYELHNSKDMYDIIHIDIANNGDVYEFSIEHYLPKLNTNGLLILEGGSEQRDNVEWMIKYNKSKIQPILEKYNDTLDIKIIGTFPSITLIKN